MSSAHETGNPVPAGPASFGALAALLVGLIGAAPDPAQAQGEALAPTCYRTGGGTLEICRDGAEAEGVFYAPGPCAFARSVQILNADDTLKLSDNFFDMNAGETRVRILSGQPSGLRVRSVYDIR